VTRISDEDDDQPVPEIPDNASEDRPLPSAGAAPDDMERVSDSDAHKQRMEWSKLRFAIILASSTTAGAVGLALVQYLGPESAVNVGSLTSASDALKLLATTSVGYIFGRSVSSREE